MPSRPIPEALLPWALSVLGLGDGVSQPGLAVVAGDASSRRYFRLAVQGLSYMLVEAPPATEKNEAFLAVRDLLDAAGVRVPALLAADLRRGFLLLEDLGERLLLPALNAASVDGHYRDAFAVLARMAVANTGQAGLGEYDSVLLQEELGRFPEWFARGLLGYEGDAAESAMLRAFSGLLAGSALEQPRVLVHRDFHSRNLMLVGEGDLAVIDFQDAVVGPITYDLVSLLRDCYIRWPRERVTGWALAFRDMPPFAELLSGVDEARFLRWFDWMGLQRHIKVLGTFARLYLRDGKPAYLADLPLVTDYVLETVDRYRQEEPLFAEFGAWFDRRLAPLVAAQDWSTTP